MFGLFENLYCYLNRHHSTAHKQDARVALASNFKGKIHSKQNFLHDRNVCTELWVLRGFLFLGFPRV